MGLACRGPVGLAFFRASTARAAVEVHLAINHIIVRVVREDFAAFCGCYELQNEPENEADTNSRLALLQVVDPGPVEGALRYYDLRLAAEALPVVVRLDDVDVAARQIVADALAAEHVDALRAAVDIAALTAPAAVKLAAVFAPLERAACIEREALLALSCAHHRMHAHLAFDGWRATHVSLAGGAVQPGIDHCVHVWIQSDVFSALSCRRVRIKSQQEACT